MTDMDEVARAASLVASHEVDLDGRRVIVELRESGHVWIKFPDWPPIALEDMRRRGRPPSETTLLLRPEPT
jgi:hypothetical protein